ncbi:MAG TPA: 2'-5' RNA ligase family protein [Nordella sp.]|nr:2'-5' RNA ligase family protein [Nordella sp.]
MTQVGFNLGTGVESLKKSPRRSERLFLGIRLDGDMARRVERFGRGFCDDHYIKGSPRPKNLLHISLHFVGDYPRLPSAIIYGARRASQTITLPPFDVTLNHIQSFEIAPPQQGKPGRHALVLLGESAPLVELHRTLGSVLRDWGLKAADHFTPHVTPLHGPNVDLKQAIDPIRFTVEDFSLIHSEKGRSRYNTLGRWPLTGEAKS